MNGMLVDTSIWVDFFRKNPAADPLLELIWNNQIVTKNLILTELIPSINKRKEERARDLLESVEKVNLTIDWNDTIYMQTSSLRSGNNNIGIPDLIIAQNALRHDLSLFENDKRFLPIKTLFGLKLYRDTAEV